MSERAVVVDPLMAEPTSINQSAAPTRAVDIGSQLVRSVWFLPTVLTAVAGMWRLGRPQLWQDELVTLSVASRSLRHILGLVQHVDAVHGTYYVFMHFWLDIFGTSALSLRTPSALAMAGAAACVALTGERLFGYRAGLLAGLCFAVIPNIARYAQEARSYAPVVLAAALATLVLVRAVESTQRRWWVAYGLCLAATGWINLVAISIVLGHAVGVLFLVGRDRRWRQLVSFAVAGAAAVVSVSPVVFKGSDQSVGQLHWIPHAKLVTVWPQIFASRWLGWAVLAVAVLALLRPSRKLAFAALVALMPLLVVWAASLGHLNYLFARYLLFILPAWAVLAGAGLAALRWRSAAAVGIAAMLVLAVPGQRAMRGEFSHTWYSYPDAPQLAPRSYEGAAQLIASRYQPGDGVAYVSGQWWYMADLALPYYLPAQDELVDVFLYRPAAEVDSLAAQECPDSSACLTAARPDRVWLVATEPNVDPFTQYLAPEASALRAQYTLAFVDHTVPGMTIALMTRTVG